MWPFRSCLLSLLDASAAAVRQRDALSRRLMIGFRVELAGIIGVLGLMVMLRYL